MQRLLAGLLAIVLVVCTVPVPNAQAQGDEVLWPTEAWAISTPEAQGIDSAVLVRVMEYIADREMDIYSLVVVRHGHIVLEAYWEPYDADARHGLASVAKSFVSALIGIAMQQGAIDSAEQPVLDFFPDQDILNRDAAKESMTLADLLTMRAGLHCEDQTNTTVEAMQRYDDWAGYMLNRAMDDPPGRTFNYCNGVSHVLSVIVGKAMDQPTWDVAQQYLFEPLGIDRVLWSRDPDGVPTGGWGLSLTPRDMARFGYLYLHNGLWDGEQIIPAAYIEESTTHHTYALQAGQGYGYQWWVNSPNSFEAVGAGGQYIFVRKASDMVIVMTSDLTISNYVDLLELLNDWVLYAVKSPEPLTPNPEAVAALNALVVAAAAAVE